MKSHLEKKGTFYQRFTLERILGDSDKIVRKTKVVCTIGPSCMDPDILAQMMDRGMTVARLNFSHGDHKSHGDTIDKLREAFKKRKDIQCAIMLDTKGPEIRTGFLKDHKAIDLTKG
jgi:pyruvate kinase